MVSFHLLSTNLVSKQTVKKLEKMNSILSESGILDFYSSFGKFLTDMRLHKVLSENITGVQPLEIQQFVHIIYLQLIALCLAFLIFIIEIIVHRHKIRRCR